MSEPMDRYDSGLINDYGGGKVGWWQDYLRAEVDRANESAEEQYENLREELDEVEQKAATERQEKAALAVSLEKIREGGRGFYVTWKSFEEALSLPDNASEILRRHDEEIKAEVWREDEAWHQRAFRQYGEQGNFAYIHKMSREFSSANARRAEAAQGGKG